MKQVRKELKGIAGKARTQIQKDYIAWPLISGLVMTAIEAAIFATREPLRRGARSGPRALAGAAGDAPDAARSRELVARRSFREPFRRTLTANVAANVIRNVWSYAIIFCGHFPDQTYTFTEEEVARRDAAAAGTSASSPAPPTSTAARCST